MIDLCDWEYLIKLVEKDNKDYVERQRIYAKRKRLREQGIKVNPIDKYKRFNFKVK